MKKNRITALVLVLVLSLALLSGCGGTKPSETKPGETGAPAGDTIKIGVLAPLTGEVAVYGNAAYNAAKLYIDQVNAAGGVDGKQIQLVVYDEKGDATEAVNAYNKLVTSDNVVAILGSVTSTPTIAVAQASVEDNIPIITPTATHTDVTSFGNNMFRACFLDPFQGSTMANFAYDVLSAKTAAVIYNNADAYSTGLMESFVATAKENGLQIVATESYGANDVDFKAQLTNIQKQNPDVIFCPDYYNNVYLLATQVKELGIKATLLGVDGTDGVLDVAEDATVLEGLYFANHYSTTDESEIVQNFLTSYKEAYNETPNALAALGYDGAMILVDALKRAGSTDAQAIIDALDATDMDCVTGHVTYDENNNPIKSCAIIQIIGGEYVLNTKY